MISRSARCVLPALLCLRCGPPPAPPALPTPAEGEELPWVVHYMISVGVKIDGGAQALDVLLRCSPTKRSCDFSGSGSVEGESFSFSSTATVTALDYGPVGIDADGKSSFDFSQEAVADEADCSVQVAGVAVHDINNQYVLVGEAHIACLGAEVNMTTNTWYDGQDLTGDVVCLVDVGEP